MRAGCGAGGGVVAKLGGEGGAEEDGAGFCAAEPTGAEEVELATGYLSK